MFLGNEFVVRQSEAGECGLACLAMIARYHGAVVDMGQLRRMFPLSARGSSLKSIIAIADDLLLNCRALKVGMDSIRDVQFPALLHWDVNHYVVLRSVSLRWGKRVFRVADPIKGDVRLSEEEFCKHFTGVVLEVSPSQKFQPFDATSRLRLTQLWTSTSGMIPALAKLLVLSAIIQTTVLLAPFLMQIAIDKALPAADKSLLVVLASGFGGILLVQALATWVRSYASVHLSNSISYQMALNLFRHVLTLPLSFFEKRHLGDIVSRFGSLQPVTDLISRGLVSAVIDGILATTTLFVMVIYSPVLAMTAIIVVALHLSIKISLFRLMRNQNSDLLSSQAAETSTFIENIRGISAIKTFAQESNRQRLWANRKLDYIRANVSSGRLSGAFEVSFVGLNGLENILFVVLAIGSVISGNLTLGMVFAFQTYKINFVGSMSRLIEQGTAILLLRVHLSRISDLVFTKSERDSGVKLATDTSASPLIEAQNVAFTYGRGLPLVLKDVSFVIRPGQTVAIVGASGAGKTTLFKVLCGLLEPSLGVVRIDGIPLSEISLKDYRRTIGVVNQEDILFSGSLVENIAFFDPEYDIGHVIECAKFAAIHDTIMNMPGRYETPVGDMGSNLSGGQKQRLLLARALYKKPRVLLMDEGTSHLDPETEAQINSGIRDMGITRILVAHRAETIRLADEIIRIGDGIATAIPASREPEEMIA